MRHECRHNWNPHEGGNFDPLCFYSHSAFFHHSRHFFTELQPPAVKQGRFLFAHHIVCIGPARWKHWVHSLLCYVPLPSQTCSQLASTSSLCAVRKSRFVISRYYRECNLSFSPPVRHTDPAVSCEPSAAPELQPDCCLLMCACSWCILCWSPWGTQTSSGSSIHSTPSMEATWRSSRASSLRGANRWWTNSGSAVWLGPLLYYIVIIFCSLILQRTKPNWCRRSSCCVSWRWAGA